MKKLFFVGLLSLCALLLVSCLENGSNTQSMSGIPGIIKLDENMKQVIMSPAFYPYPFYDSYIATVDLKEDECVLFGYTVDFNDEKNVDYQTNGLIEGSLTSIASVTQYPCYPYMILDTAILRENEQPIAYAVSSGGHTTYFLGRLFLFSDITVDTKQETSWCLYYDSNLPAKEVDGKTVYSLFLRAEIAKEGVKPSINGYATNAFDIQRFINSITTF
ncbi:MAG: hypothetical protein LBP98_07945, partial [Tannerella sp.]|nr:hypothetical protein [Tannerella sp.]